MCPLDLISRSNAPHNICAIFNTKGIARIAAKLEEDAGSDPLDDPLDEEVAPPRVEVDVREEVDLEVDNVPEVVGAAALDLGLQFSGSLFSASPSILVIPLHKIEVAGESAPSHSPFVLLLLLWL